MCHDSVFHVSGCVLLVVAFKGPAVLLCVSYCRNTVVSFSKDSTNISRRLSKHPTTLNVC
jgi:hypothetical protein